MIRKMYYMCMMMGVLSMLMSCKDEDSTLPTQKWLTKIQRNGEKVLEFQYNTEKKLVRMNSFEDDGVFYAYTVHEYNHQGIRESRRYQAIDDDLQFRIVYTLNDLGLITKAEYYLPETEFTAVGGTYQFSYDVSGNLKSMAYNPPAKPVRFIKEFTYNEAGNRITARRTEDPNQPTKSVSYEIDYTPGQRSVPDHWHEYLTILAISEVEEYVWGMFSDNKRQTYFNDEGEITSDYLTEASEQQFDVEGYLTQQALTGILLSSLSPQSVSSMVYEYTP